MSERWPRGVRKAFGEIAFIYKSPRGAKCCSSVTKKSRAAEYTSTPVGENLIHCAHYKAEEEEGR